MSSVAASTSGIPPARDLALTSIRSITGITALVFEQVCCSILERECPRFLRGIEGAAVDCGILAGVEEPPGSLRPEERLPWAQKRYGRRKVLLPLDFKMVAPGIQAAEKGPIYDYSIHVTHEQRSVAAFIIGSTACPDKVAVVPHWYLDRSFPRSTPYQRQFHSRSSYLRGSQGQIEPFPLEWAPFVIPISYLPQALQGLHDLVYNGTPWTNPYSGLVFDRLPRPPTAALDLLLPQETDMKHGEAEQVTQLEQALAKHSSKYRIERLLVRAGVGDFQIVRQGGNNARANIEFKRKWGEMYWEQGKRAVALPLVPGIVTALNPLQPVDFYLINLVRPAGYYLLVPASKVPAASFDSANTIVRWVDDENDLLLKHSVGGLDLDEAFVRRLEAILDRYEDFSIHTVRRPDELMQKFVLKGSVNDIGSEDLDSTAMSSVGVSTRVAGDSRKWSRLHYNGREAELLDEACARIGRGCVISMGKNTSGGCVYSPVRARYCDLALSAPLLVINFAPIQHIDKIVPSDMRRPISFIHVTHATCKSIFILAPSLYGDKHDKMTHAAGRRYVVPSEALDNDDLRAFNAELVSNGHVSTLKVPERQLPLHGGESIVHYAHEYDKIAGVLFDLCMAPTTQETFTLASSAVNYIVDDYLTSKLTLLKHAMAFLHGSTFWAFKNSTDPDETGPPKKIGGQGAKTGPKRHQEIPKSDTEPDDDEELARADMSDEDEEFLGGLLPMTEDHSLTA